MDKESHYIVKNPDHEQPFRIIPDFMMGKSEYTEKIGCNEAFNLVSIVNETLRMCEEAQVTGMGNPVASRIEQMIIKKVKG